MKSKNILTWIAGGLMLTACSSENIWDYDGSMSDADAEYVNVTFSVTPETLTAATRAGEDNSLEGGPGKWQTLSKGSEVDMLIYAVYDENYNLMMQYSDGVVDYTEEKMPDDFKVNFKVDKNNHPGQTIMYVGDKLYKGNEVTVSLRLMRGSTYHIAFWAQSSKTDAYVTDNLHTVEVKYKKADGSTNYLNNDETRDAFCKVEKLTVTDGGTRQEVILTRPLAQINVGTTGADYKNMEKGIYTAPNRTVTYSSITIKGVAKYFDVVKDKVLTESDIAESIDETSPYYGVRGKKATDDVTFDWAKVPAYYNMEIPSGNLYESVTGEELLTIDLNQDGEILGYRTSYPTLGSQGGYMTEEFKYLSMSYVLVPWSDEEYPYVLTNIAVNFATDAKGGNPLTSFDVSQIPSRRNWRTNIIGGMKWMKDPTNPNDPYEDPDNPNPDNPDDPDNPSTPPNGPDPSTVFNTVYARPTIVSDFIGDKVNNEGGLILVEDYQEEKAPEE